MNKLSVGLLAVTLLLMTAGVMFAASALTGANQAPDASGQVAAQPAPTASTTDWRIPNPKDAMLANAPAQHPANEPAPVPNPPPSSWRASLPERRGEAHPNPSATEDPDQ
ncbi:MAG: hypothetical protein JO023_26045 [Chloroflexi bacterium]|nr:hypothetical protein [Chloroflexota bacterium]